MSSRTKTVPLTVTAKNVLVTFFYLEEGSLEESRFLCAAQALC